MKSMVLPILDWLTCNCYVVLVEDSLHTKFSSSLRPAILDSLWAYSLVICYSELGTAGWELELALGSSVSALDEVPMNGDLESVNFLPLHSCHNCGRMSWRWFSFLWKSFPSSLRAFIFFLHSERCFVLPVCRIGAIYSKWRTVAMNIVSFACRSF